MINFKLLTRYEHKSKLPNITPLIDLIFNLLLFFLLTYAVASPALQVELPAAASAQVHTPNGVQVVIKEDGTLFLQGQPVGVEQLATGLLQELGKQEEQEVTISAARQLPLERVIRVMDIAQQAGARQLSLAVEAAAGSDRVPDAVLPDKEAVPASRTP